MADGGSFIAKTALTEMLSNVVFTADFVGYTFFKFLTGLQNICK